MTELRMSIAEARRLCTRCDEPLPELMATLGLPDKTHMMESTCIINLREKVKRQEKQLKQRQMRLDI